MSGSVSSISSTAKTKNAKVGTLFFDPRSDQFSGNCYTIRDYHLLEIFDAITGDESDHILWIAVYSSPLQWWQINRGILYHAYVVMETDEWFYSLERTEKNITLQRAKDLMFVRDMRERKWRKTKLLDDDPTRLIRAHGKGTIRGVIRYLYRENLLHNRYDLFKDNCKHLTQNIFNAFNCEGERWDFFQ
jgi:hypothetical protein